MKTVVKRLYEGMFLVDSALAASDWDGVNDAIKTVLERSEAEIVSIRKWDECKLAYDIKGKSRGTYILAYFRVDGEKVASIERDAQLSEKIIRVLVLNAEHMTEADIEKDTPATAAEVRLVAREKAAEEKAAKEKAAKEEAVVVEDSPPVEAEAVEEEVVKEEVATEVEAEEAVVDDTAEETAEDKEPAE